MKWLLTDFVQIQADKAVEKLSSKDKIRLMDQVLDTKNGVASGLQVGFYLSHSGRRINNRIYTPWGQKAGIDSLTSPFPKPIIRNHDTDAEPLGRFTGGRYEDLSSGAVQHFNRMQDFMALQQSFDLKDAEKTIALLHRSKVLLDPKWQGLGRMHTTARITDKDAVEKFLDKRYLTFSGGFDTDSLSCSACLSDWRQGTFCDHRPGEIIDGLPVFFLAGSYTVKEASVVLDPANDLSIVTSLELTDSSLPDSFLKCDWFKQDQTTIYITDSTYSFEQEAKVILDGNQTPADTETPAAQLDQVTDSTEPEVATPIQDSIDPGTRIKAIMDSAEEMKKLTDQLSGDSHMEITFLVRLHDSLHRDFDWELKYSEDYAGRVPQDLFGLHAKLHDLAQAGGWRGSIVNGALDGFDAAGEVSDQYMMKAPAGDSAVAELTDTTPVVPTPEISQVLVDQISKQVLGAVLEKLELAKTQVVVTDDAILPETSDAKTEEEETEEAKKTGSEPVSDFEELKQDYSVALKQIETLKARLEEALGSHAKMQSKDFVGTDSSDKLENMWTWFCSLEEQVTNKTLSLKPVENPSGASSDASQPNQVSKLGTHERNIVDQYQKLLDEKDEKVADSWFQSQRRYLPKSFHPKDFLGPRR